MGQGFQKILKIYGEMKATDNKGNSISYVWDYANDKARIKGEMTKEEIAASEKAKWMQLRKQAYYLQQVDKPTFVMITKLLLK